MNNINQATKNVLKRCQIRSDKIKICQAQLHISLPTQCSNKTSSVFIKVSGELH